MDLVTRYYTEMWNQWNFDLVDELLAEDFVFRGSLGRQLRGREEFKSYMRLVRSACSNFHNEVQGVVSCGNNIVARVEYTGNHDGDILGLRPTFRRIQYPGIGMFETDGQLLRSGYVVGDRLALLEQILGNTFWSTRVVDEVEEALHHHGIHRASASDVQWCADLMAQSEPWITLRRDRDSSLRQLGDPSKELYILVNGNDRVGFVLIDMRGAFAGYIQSVCVAPQFRNASHGAALMKFAEERILKDEPNIFLCVSSFNSDAQRFYERQNYERVGELRDFIIPGASEIILRKTTAPKAAFGA